jgi:hypothetical protein
VGADSIAVAQAGVSSGRVESGLGWAGEGCAMLTTVSP